MPRQRCTFKYQLLGFPLSKTFFSDFSLCLRRGISYIPVNTFLFEDMRVLPLCQCPFCSGWNKILETLNQLQFENPGIVFQSGEGNIETFFLNAHILVDWVLSATKIKLEHLSLLSFLFDFNLFVSVVIPLVMLWYLSVYFQVLVPSQPKQRNLCSYVFFIIFLLNIFVTNPLFPVAPQCIHCQSLRLVDAMCIYRFVNENVPSYLNFHFKAVLTVFKMKTYSNILKRNVDKASKIVCETFSF